MSAHAWHQAVAEEKRAQIVEAARALFLECGFGRATMAELAVRAGVSATTLYKHFEQKEDIFTAVLDALANRFESELDKAGQTRGNFARQLETFGLRYAGLLAETETVAMTRLIIAEAKMFQPIAARFHEAMKGPVFHRLASIISSAVAEGILQKHPHSDSMGQFLGYIERSVLLPRLLDPAHSTSPANDAYVVRLAVKTLMTMYGSNTTRH